MDEEVALPAGRMTPGITRRGPELLRPTGPWSAAVHELLNHLDARHAPRFLGLEADREILTYIEGEVPIDPHWQPGRGPFLPPYARSEAALIATARLIRRLHNAAADFRPSRTGYRFDPRPPRPGEIISHGDLGPWNTVYRNGLPVAFIDWAAAGPVEPLVELAAAAWEFVPLLPPDQLSQCGFDPIPDIAARLRLFTDAYGVTNRPAIVPALQRARLAAAARVAHAPVNATEAARSLEHHARELHWLHATTPRLLKALSQ